MRNSKEKLPSLAIQKILSCVRSLRDSYRPLIAISRKGQKLIIISYFFIIIIMMLLFLIFLLIIIIISRKRNGVPQFDFATVIANWITGAVFKDFVAFGASFFPPEGFLNKVIDQNSIIYFIRKHNIICCYQFCLYIFNLMLRVTVPKYIFYLGKNCEVVFYFDRELKLIL